MSLDGPLGNIQRGKTLESKHLGRRFDDCLDKEDLLDEARTIAIKRVIALQIAWKRSAVEHRSVQEILHFVLDKGTSTKCELQ